MNNMLIRITGNAIDVSPDGKTPFPEDCKPLLENELRYTYMRLLRGQEARDTSGIPRRVRQELRLLYTYDKYKRFVCGAGFLYRVRDILSKNGYKVTLLNCDAPHPRPNRFDEDWDNVARNFTFRARQDVSLATVADHYRCMIEGPTGIGKTHLYKAICLLYTKANILIVTKRKDIAEGIKLELSKDIPNVGQLCGGQKKSCRVTVCTAGSLHKVDADRIDLLIGEEVHELAAPTYSAELSKFRNCRMYGFSATPSGRMDNADMKLESLFGPVMFKMSYQEATDLGLVVPIKVKWIHIAGNNPASGMADVPRQRWGIWRNEYRNQCIADAAKQFTDDEQVLIMVTTFDHAVHLRQFLPDFTLCYAERSDDGAFKRFIKNGMLPEDEPVMTPTRRQLLRLQFTSGELKKVIATDVWSTGVSFNSLGVMIRADARSSTIMDSQIPGRVCRLHEESGKTYGLVIDCLDQFDPGFRSAALKRKRNYDAKGWDQELPRYR